MESIILSEMQFYEYNFNQENKMTDYDVFKVIRETMVEEQIRSRGIQDKRVLEVMKKIPRHLFIPSSNWKEAYNDYPLEIGHRQTISQPYIVALMTELLQIKENHKILEIGTGSGYQTAILASLAKEVFTVERIEGLYDQAKETLNKMAFNNIRYRLGNGYTGWKKHSLYDGIIVTASPARLPPDLITQLKVKGRLVIPVGEPSLQFLNVYTKNKSSSIHEETICGVRFVELVKE
jgi:protein-L-isoaspartate(D-aspartate) O-methyltransferase